MMSYYNVVMAAFLWTVSMNGVHAFTLPNGHRLETKTSWRTTSIKVVRSEWSTVDDDDDSSVVGESLLDQLEPPKVSLPKKESTVVDAATATTPSYEYAALAPGTVVEIEIGDLGLARKAWKKRRRSGSPLLVPCSVLNVDRESMLRWNLIYLLHKYGRSQKDGIVISLQELTKRHREHLKSSLAKHAASLGYDSPKDLVNTLLLPKRIQREYGIQLLSMEDENNNPGSALYIKAPITKSRALRKASKVALLQVSEKKDSKFGATSSIMEHTGSHLFQQPVVVDHPPAVKKKYQLMPLSAALRVQSQRDHLENLQQGAILPALVFDYDTMADGGSPLLTLSLHPTRNNNNKIISRFQISQKDQTTIKYEPITNPNYHFQDLKLGDGPFDAKIVKLGKGMAMVDFGIGRTTVHNVPNNDGKKDVGSPSMVKVYATLRFQDAIVPQDNPTTTTVEDETDGRDEDDMELSRAKIAAAAAANAYIDSDDTELAIESMLEKIDDAIQDEEEEEGVQKDVEDISHLFQINEDGNLVYDNPDTGMTETLVGGMDSDDEDDDDTHEQKTPPKTYFLRVGDTIPVYIKFVAKQSSQVMVTTDPSMVQGKSAKKIKKEGEATKKLDRLAQQLGGLDRIHELTGKEYDGTVKATSQTGNWLYVQPNGDDNLPVGVATIQSDVVSHDLAQGDLVRIKMKGIDKGRGQLSMEVIEKLAP